MTFRQTRTPPATASRSEAARPLGMPEAPGPRFAGVLEVFAGVLALLVGAWAALAEPALAVFERTMRALGIVGPVLSLLWLLHTVVVVFVAMFAAVFLVSLTGGALARWQERRRRHG